MERKTKRLINFGTMLLISIALSACGSTQFAMKKGRFEKNSTKVYIKKGEDPRNWYPDVLKKCGELGFKIVENETDSDFIVEFSYVYYLDAVVYTYNLMNMIIYDTKTTEIVASGSYAGDAPYGPKTFISATFGKLRLN